MIIMHSQILKTTVISVHNSLYILLTVLIGYYNIIE